MFTLIKCVRTTSEWRLLSKLNFGEMSIWNVNSKRALTTLLWMLSLNPDDTCSKTAKWFNVCTWSVFNGYSCPFRSAAHWFTSEPDHGGTRLPTRRETDRAHQEVISKGEVTQRFHGDDASGAKPHPGLTLALGHAHINVQVHLVDDEKRWTQLKARSGVFEMVLNPRASSKVMLLKYSTNVSRSGRFLHC